MFRSVVIRCRVGGVCFVISLSYESCIVRGRGGKFSRLTLDAFFSCMKGADVSWLASADG